MKKKSLRNLRPILYVIGGLLLLIVFFCGLPYLTYVLYEILCNGVSAGMGNLGTFGDSYGIYNALFSLFAFLGLILTLLYQNKENKKSHIVDQYYKMLDFQRGVVDNLAVAPVKKTARPRKTANGTTPAPMEPKPVCGRKVFVEFKLQIKYLIKTIREVNQKESLNLSEPDIADIAYSVFYYGASADWIDFMKEYLKDYPDNDRLVQVILAGIKADKHYALDRTNQNAMSVYSRNLYNAIKLIDSSECLDDSEKQSLIKILRAQMSHAELYVLFFNVLSRFGKKWIENDYMNKYQLIQNIPAMFCDGYNPKDYFPSITFESEDIALSPFRETIVQRD